MNLPALEADWRAGLLSRPLIALRHGIKERMLDALAEQHGWGPMGSLAESVARQTLGALMDRAVSAEDRQNRLHTNAQETRSLPAPSPATPEKPWRALDHDLIYNQQEQIARYAQIVAAVVEQHREHITHARRYAASLIAQMQALPDPNETNVGTISARLSVVAKYARTMRDLIHLERQAYGLDMEIVEDAHLSVDEMLSELRPD